MSNPNNTLRPDSVVRTDSRAKQRGTVLIVFTCVMALVLIPMIGLAIDFSIVFWAKAKLSAAVDAAALAGGRSVNVYETVAQNQSTGAGSPVAIATQWFWANFPSGWLGTSVVGGAPSITVQPTQYSMQQVTVTASATVPLYFLRLIRFNSVTISATAQSSRRNLNLILVLDRSSSMGAPPYGSNACPSMITAAQNFVNMFTDGLDTVGLVTFSSSANNNPIDYAPTTHFKTNSPTLSSTIGSISCVGTTSTAQALYVAYQAIKSLGQPSAMNAIVLFTDGQPNEVVANNWPIKTLADSRLDPNSWTTTSVPASSCFASVTLSGGLSIYLAPGQTDSNTGYTMGIIDTSTRVAVNSDAGFTGGSGCAFSQSGSAVLNVRKDVAYIPTTDAYGNSTSCCYKTPETFTSDVANTYNGYIRPDMQIPAVIAAAFNAADNMAKTIRTDPTYNIVLYTIGLDGAPDIAIDSTFLERVANDPRSTSTYDSSQPAGYYAYAANPGALNQAFNQVASQVLRLSR